MAKKKRKKVEVWIAVIAAISAILIAIIQFYGKNDATKEIRFESKDIKSSTIFIGDGNSFEEKSH